MARIPVLALIAASCSSPPRHPPATAPSDGRPPVGDGVVDSGAFVTIDDDAVVARETFSISRAGDHLILRATAAAADEPQHNRAELELEVDAGYRPIRATRTEVYLAQEHTYRLTDTPPTLTVTGKDVEPVSLVAASPLDVYLPGDAVALTALCQVRGERLLRSVTPHAFAVRDDLVLAYEAAPVGTLRRIVVDRGALQLEVACAGDRLIAAGTRPDDAWTFRAGSDAELAALRAAPRPPPHAWVYPAIEAAPWSAYSEQIVGAAIVARDEQTHVTRLTAYDLATGAALASRDFQSRGFGRCVGAATGLVCEVADGDVRVLDPRSLEDRVDVGPILASAAGTVAPDEIAVVDARRVAIDETRAIELDLARRTGAVVPRPPLAAIPPPGICDEPVMTHLSVRSAAWTIEDDHGTPTLHKRGMGVDLTPVPLALHDPRLVGCGPTYDQPFVRSNDRAAGDYRVAALAADGRPIWTSDNLGAKITELGLAGDTLIVATEDQARRLVALDVRTGAPRWVAAGPQPRR